jgi:hypothetical protein
VLGQDVPQIRFYDPIPNLKESDTHMSEKSDRRVSDENHWTTLCPIIETHACPNNDFRCMNYYCVIRMEHKSHVSYVWLIFGTYVWNIKFDHKRCPIGWDIRMSYLHSCGLSFFCILLRLKYASERYSPCNNRVIFQSPIGKTKSARKW